MKLLNSNKFQTYLIILLINAITIEQILTQLISPNKLRNLTYQEGFSQNYRILEANFGLISLEKYNQ